ncbi:MAG: hypothetical protein AB1546_13190, partial [bacterium]
MKKTNNIQRTPNCDTRTANPAPRTTHCILILFLLLIPLALTGCGGGGGNRLSYIPKSLSKDCSDVKITGRSVQSLTEENATIWCVQITSQTESAEQYIITSTVSVNSGTEEQFYAVLFDPQCNVITPSGSYTWDVSSSLGTIDSNGLFTANTVTTDTTGEITVEYKDFTDTISVTVTAGGNPPTAVTLSSVSGATTSSLNL